LGAVGAAVVIILAIIFAAGGGAGGEDAASMPVFKVKKGLLNINVTESGTIQAREQEILVSKVEGRTTIIYLIEEGARVKKGELLVELDASSLMDDRINQQIKVQNAEADFIQSRENFEVVKSQAESDVSKAKLDLQFAKEDLQKYLEGEYPTQLKEKESDITLKKEELERARQKLEWSEKLFEEKYISKTERDGDRLAAQRAELQHELAQDELELFKEYTHKRKLTELEADLEQKKMALERTERKARADVIQAEARLKARESEFKRQKDRLEKIEEQIENTKIIAPLDGMVVYATSARHSWRNVEPLDEGQEVRERQELIYLPTADSMSAAVKIHESSLKKIKLEQPVKIHIDALPGREFTGKVSKIAPLPDPQSMWMNPDLKVFNTLIEIDQDGSDMRTGMSCRAEIMIDKLQNVLYVPVQAIVRKADQAFAYVRKGGSIEPRPVTIGLDNNRMIHVKSGLEEGEEVVLTPPLSEARAKEPSEEPADTAQEETEAPIPPETSPQGPSRQGTPSKEGMDQNKSERKRPSGNMPSRQGRPGQSSPGNRTRPDSGGSGQRRRPSSGSPQGRSGK